MLVLLLIFFLNENVLGLLFGGSSSDLSGGLL